MTKLIILSILLSILTACTNSIENIPKAPLDTKTVEKYNIKVYRNNPVFLEQQGSHEQTELPLNQSDYQLKNNSRSAIGSTPIILMPSIGYYYGRYRYY